MAVTGRPEKKIDWERVAKLAKVQTPRTAIAAIMSCSVLTLERATKRDHGKTFTEYVEGFAAIGQAAIQEEIYDRAFDREDKASPMILLYAHKVFAGGILGQGVLLQPPAQTIQIVDSSRSTVDLLREVLGKPKLITSGEDESD